MNNAVVVVGLVRDLFFVPKIRGAVQEAGGQYKNFREIAPLLEEISSNAVALCVVDLNSTGIDPIALVRQVAALPKRPASLGYFAHVADEIAAQALASGLSKAVPRSKIIQSITAAVHEAVCGTQQAVEERTHDGTGEAGGQ